MEKLKFHWGAPLDSGQLKATDQYEVGRFDIDSVIDFAQAAEKAGIESLLMAISFHMPDPVPLLSVLLRETSKIKFILAYRPGLLSPTLFTQIVNTLSWIGKSRVDINIVAGISPAEQAYYGDYCDHSQRYARTNEFLEVSKALWHSTAPYSFEGDFYRIKDATLGLPFENGDRPGIFISGGSPAATDIAIKHADCLLCYGDTPENLTEQANHLHSKGLKLGIRMHIIARETREQALSAVAMMSENPDEAHRAKIAEFVQKCDSHAVKKSFDMAAKASDDWLSEMIWSGAVPYRGGPALSIVGSYDEVAAYFQKYREAGVSEFILSGWPTREEMEMFCQEVLPRYHQLEELEVCL